MTQEKLILFSLLFLYVGGFVFTARYARKSGISSYDTIFFSFCSWLGSFALWLFSNGGKK